jgi:hypothetical protein
LLGTRRMWKRQERRSKLLRTKTASLWPWWYVVMYLCGWYVRVDDNTSERTIAAIRTIQSTRIRRILIRSILIAWSWKLS